MNTYEAWRYIGNAYTLAWLGEPETRLTTEGLCNALDVLWQRRSIDAMTDTTMHAQICKYRLLCSIANANFYPLEDKLSRAILAFQFAEEAL